ncbi:hypothetical protein CBR_g44525 [Chara braunii]|uniref:VTT domain-containing protein n=1 Tax=Chara braunii TaxID=69332 RepID=A0A388LXX8_CHABU|nr:hypothetical protein CBR_g44525 [Chara braunii]|eukprot:GBG87069.1 hypothetical protein CBR_g44525 [Chara braunii]
MSKTGSLLAAALVALVAAVGYYYFDKEQAQLLVEATQKRLASLGVWALPAYIAVHTAAIAACFPYTLAFEAGAGLLFGLWRGIICVIVAKACAASLSFWLGRLILHNWSWLGETVQRNRYFGVVREGVARDGWRFVLFARFSPLPSYFVNYALAMTDVRYFRDFLLPTLAGGIPMIVQNTSLGSLASSIGLSLSLPEAMTVKEEELDGLRGLAQRAAPFAMPSLGILCSLWLTWRVRAYTRSSRSIDDAGFSPEGEEPAEISEGAFVAEEMGPNDEGGFAWDGGMIMADRGRDRSPLPPNVSEGANSVSSPDGRDSQERGGGEREYEVTSPGRRSGLRSSTKSRSGPRTRSYYREIINSSRSLMDEGWGGAGGELGEVPNGVLSPRNVMADGHQPTRSSKPAASSPRKNILSPKGGILTPKVASARRGRPRRSAVVLSEDASSKITLSSVTSSPMTRARARAMALALADAEQHQQTAEPWS